MRTRSLDHQGLLGLLTRSLGQPSARVGMRLRSERELAASLRVSRARVAWAVGKLAKQGLVARRTGSGTFLRRVPDAMPSLAGDTRGDASDQLIAVNRLFTGDAEPQVRGELKIRSALKIGVGWLSLGDLSRANRLTLDGMGARAQELGHTLTFHAFGETGQAGFDKATQLLTRHRFDGLLLCAIDFVTERLDTVSRVIGQKRPPCAYFYSADADPRCKPAVTLDAVGATRRAVAELAAGGYRHIALIDLTSSRNTRAYDGAMHEAGLEYRQKIAAGSGFAMSTSDIDIVRAGRRCAEQLLDSSRRPDAIYVADDILMLGVAEILAERGLKPGRDLGVISLSNVGMPLPPAPAGVVWSTLAMDPTRLGRQTIDLMLDVLDAGDKPLPSVRTEAMWQPGTTHTRG